MSTQLFHRVLDTKCLARLLSDHSPLVLSVSIFDKKTGTYRWILNSSFLKQPEFCTFIREQINFFTLTNKPSAPNNFIFWDALKNTYQAERAITRSKQRYYELGEKASKVLAWQLKTEESKRTINAIETRSKDITYNPTEINDTFKKYYTDLYFR